MSCPSRPGHWGFRVIAGWTTELENAMKTMMLFAVTFVSALMPSLLSAAPGIEVEQPAAALESAARQRVVREAARLIREHYVFPDLGARMADHVLAELNRGAYSEHNEQKAFLGALTSDLRSVCDDKHIFVFENEPEAREVAADKGLLSEEETARIRAAYLKEDRRTNFGVAEAALLPGNIGLLQLDYFSSHVEAQAAIVGAMNDLAGADALIIDLRENGGGGGGGVGRLLASYFFGPNPQPLTGVFWRSSGETIPAFTLEKIPGKRRPTVPLYLLTSARTFSAAEDFSYSLQQLERATIVGEPTKGGAHPVDVLIIEEDILLQVPIGRSVNPITGANWEGIGVQPNLAVPAADARVAAHRAALATLIDRAGEAGERAALLETLDGLGVRDP